MHKAAVGIIGASGFSGLEATRLLAAHPRVELAFVTSDRWVGDAVERRTGLRGGAGALRYVSSSDSERLWRGCEAVLLATPAEASLELAPRVLEAGARVIDLSGAFRLRDAALYPRYYKLDHPHPALLERAVYGLP